MVAVGVKESCINIYRKTFKAKLSCRKDAQSRALKEKMEPMLDRCLCLLFEAFEGHKEKPTPFTSVPGNKWFDVVD